MSCSAGCIAAGQRAASGRSSDEIGTWQVLVVDDGSEDATVDIVEARPEAQPALDGSPPDLILLRRRHAGKGAAVRAGVLAARGDLIVFTDADMATPPDQIPLLTEALAIDDLALGSRIQPDGSDRRASQPTYRRMLGRIYRLLAGVWVTADVPDTQCGFKGFRRAAAHDIFGRLRTSGHRLRCRGHLPGPPPRLQLCGRAGHVARHPRFAHAGPPTARDERAMGLAAHPHHPPPSGDENQPHARRPGLMRPGSAAECRRPG